MASRDIPPMTRQRITRPPRTSSSPRVTRNPAARNHQRDWAEKRAADLHRQLEMLRSGKLRSFEKKGAREVDTTARDIERIEGWLSELATLPAKVSAGNAP